MDISSLDIPAAQQRSWSPLQEAIFSALASPDNLIIEAVAGSGKTTTILECMARSPGHACFLAFNKAIADDLRSRVQGAEVRTLNALGHSIVTKRLPGVKLESWKTSNFVRSKLSTEDYADFGSQVTRLVSIAKGCAFGIINNAERHDFAALADDFELDIPTEKFGLATQLAVLAFAYVIQDFTCFDFDDQLFLPVYYDWTFPTFDTVFIDEAQDLNAIQHLMLERLKNRGARIIAVGDTRQAIYGFRGAKHDSMAVLREHFSMRELPLSITYRCDRRITELAQSIVPHIRYRDDAPEGNLIFSDTFNIITVPDETLIVCRNNAPLFKYAMRALRERRPVRVMSNFLAQLQSFVKSFKTRDLSILETRLTKWYETASKAAEDAGFYGLASFLQDKYETVLSLIREAAQFDDILNALERFANSKTGPTLSTIHKAKGLEAPSVTILERNLLPSRFARSETALYQEDNLLYVAITRAKHSLIIHQGE